MKIVTTQDKNVLEITYWPTDICNFSCNYCFPGSTPGTNRYPKDLENTLEQFSNLFKKYNELGKNTFNISIAGGGEPTIWPELGEFCKRIKGMANVTIQIVSNASRTLRWWNEYKGYIDSAALSLHHKEVDIKHFINVADLLYEAEVEVTAQVLMDPTNWDTCKTLLDDLYTSKYDWFIQLKEVIGYGEYSNKQKEFLRNSLKRLEPSERLIKNLDKYNLIKSVQIQNDDVTVSKMNTYTLNGTNKFQGWMCSFPSERIAIDTLGNIKGSCGVEFSELKPVRCTKESCDCAPDTHVTKWST